MQGAHERMKWFIFEMVSLILVVISCITVGYLAEDDISSLVMKTKYKNAETPEDCINLTMKETAYCLNDYVEGIFKYKVRNDSENPTLEELIEDGGDCKNWAELYVKHINELGFEAERPVIDIQNKKLHTFAIISDETGYCTLDQRSIDCFEFE